jgi:putative DNA primase/helicase
MSEKRGYHLEQEGIVYWSAPKLDKEGKETEPGMPFWLCAPLEVLGMAVDEDDRWGKLLRWTDPNKEYVNWVMPMKLLSRKDDLWGELLDRGLMMTGGQKERQLLHTYLNEAQPENRVHSTRRLGWFEKTEVSYILPDRIVGSAAEVFFTGNAKAYQVKGTLAEWQQHVGRICQGNSRLVLAVSMAFAAPLLYLLGEPSGGFHIHGLSQTGKTKALCVGTSTTGVEMRTWRTTDNARYGRKLVTA